MLISGPSLQGRFKLAKKKKEEKEKKEKKDKDANMISGSLRLQRRLEKRPKRYVTCVIDLTKA